MHQRVSQGQGSEVSTLAVSSACCQGMDFRNVVGWIGLTDNGVLLDMHGTWQGEKGATRKGETGARRERCYRRRKSDGG